MAAIVFRLWVFDNVDLTDAKRAELGSLIDLNFMTPLIGGTVSAATSRVVGPDELIAAGRFDAVVFLTNIGFRGVGSVLKRAGGNPEEAVGNENLKGLTQATMARGGVAEVYWNRCEMLSDVAASIFHEACHLKFQETRRDEMHNSVGPDGTRVKILAARQGIGKLPNSADIFVFKSKIGRVLNPLRTTLP